MRTWKNINYLLDGNSVQKKAYGVINELMILETLKDYDPILVGTIPIGLHIPGSDLDIICEVHEPDVFKSFITSHYSKYANYSFKTQYEKDVTIVVVNFTYKGFDFEIYAKPGLTRSFNGYQHMVIEHRILNLLDIRFRETIISLKKCGLKTEPAFSKLLGLRGDPYEELLKLKNYSDSDIINLYKKVSLQ